MKRQPPPRPPRDEPKRPERQPPTYGITEADLPY